MFLALVVNTGDIVVGAVVVTIGVLVGAGVKSLMKSRERAAHLEARRLVDKAVTIALEKMTAQMNTGNGKTLGEYVAHLGTQMTETRDDVRYIRGTIGDIDDRLTNLEAVSHEKLPGDGSR
jgi:hypothetical protein